MNLGICGDISAYEYFAETCDRLSLKSSFAKFLVQNSSRHATVADPESPTGLEDGKERPVSVMVISVEKGGHSRRGV